MRHIFLSLLFLLISTNIAVFAQKVDDPLALFDEKKVWYNGFTETWFNFFSIPEGDVRRSIEQWEELGRDISKSGNDLDGTYTSGGETHGEYLRWSLGKGFLWLKVNKCMGGPMEITQGRVEPFDGGIRLISEVTYGESEGHHGGHANKGSVAELVTVRWLGNIQLVPKADLASFADYVAGLGEYNEYAGFIEGFPFLVRMTNSSADDDSETKFEMPVYPAGYDRFSKRPIRGTIDRVVKTKRTTNPDSETHDDLSITLRVIIENPAGLTKGMRLLAANQHLFMERFEVRSLTGRIAIVEYTRPTIKRNCIPTPDWDCKDLDHVKPDKGMVLSTNGY